jgi:hypothetical protein
LIEEESAGPKRRWWFFPLLFFLTAIICLLVAEAAVRIFWSPDHPRQPRRYEFDLEVGIAHIPGHYLLPFRRCVGGQSECEDVSVNFTINDQGFRGRNFRDPAGHPLVAVLGDSMIEAAQVDDDKTACRILEESLRQQFDAEVRNIGVSSAGLVHYYARWRKYVASMRPDALVIATLGINDFRNCSTSLEHFIAMRPHYTESADGKGEVSFEPAPNPHSRLRRLAASLYEPLETVRFFRWLKEARKETVEADASGLFPDFRIYEDPPAPEYAEATAIGQQYLERLIKEATAAGSRVIVVYLPWSGEAIDAEWAALAAKHQQSEQAARATRNRPEQLVKTTAEAAGARFVSFSEFIRSLPPERLPALWHIKTDSHLTEEGNRMLAECLKLAVTDALKPY